MRHSLFALFLLSAILINAFDPAFQLTDTPRKSVFLSGELDISSVSSESFDRGLDSMLYSGFRAAIEYRNVMPFGAEIRMGYDAGLTAISGGIAYNYATFIFPVSSRTEIFYTYSRNGLDVHEFFSRESIMLNVIDYIKFYYEVMYCTGRSDCGMSGGLLISIPFDFMYFEKLSISYENQFYSWDFGTGNNFIAGISLTTWGHQFSLYASNFNTAYPYQYTGSTGRYFLGAGIKRNFEF